jgi:hypothetical protein
MGDSTQGFELAMQALYHLIKLPISFLWLFWRWDLVNYLPWLASNHKPLDFSLSSS